MYLPHAVTISARVIMLRYMNISRNSFQSRVCMVMDAFAGSSASSQESTIIQRAPNGPSPWFPSVKRLPVAVAELPLWPRHTNQAGDAKLVAAQGAAAVAEESPDKAQGSVVVEQEHNQAGDTDAISAAGATTSTAIAPILLMSGEQKRILRWKMAR